LETNKTKNKMKKLMMGMLVCAAVFGACSREPGYKVTGTVEGAEDGDTVRLVTYSENWESIVLQETVIKDGKFLLEGRQDTADFRHLVYVKEGGGKGMTEFVLENGEIHIVIAPGSYDYYIMGTPVNEAWCAFHNENERLCGLDMDIYRALRDTTLTDEQRSRKTEEADEMDAKLKALRLQFCKDNIRNIAGMRSLALYQRYFEPEVVAELAAQIPDECIDSTVRAMKEEIANKQKTAVGRPFTDFTMRTPDGKELSVGDVVKRGKVTMIDFWASWCGPCRAEMPYVKAAYEKFHDKGFEIIGVSLDHTADAWTKAIEDLELTWAQISDLKGWECEGAVLYGVKAIPATVLIQDGKIIARNLRGEAIDEKLAEILE